MRSCQVVIQFGWGALPDIRFSKNDEALHFERCYGEEGWLRLGAKIELRADCTGMKRPPKTGFPVSALIAAKEIVLHV